MRKKMLILRGIDDIKPTKPDDFLFIGLDLTSACNLNCVYCFAKSGEPNKNELSIDEKENILNQARKLGAKSLIIAGAGEPLLDHDFIELIKYAHSLGLVSVVYTNGTLINKEITEFMYKHNVTPIVKLDSLDSKVYDSITMVNGSYIKAINAINELISAGYKKKDNITRLATATLYLKQNLSEIKAIERWALEKDIKPTFDFLGIHGKARDNEDKIKPSLSEILEIKGSMNIGDESLCPQKQACKIWQYGIIISNVGDAKFCTEIPTKDIGNIRDYKLEDLLKIKKEKYPAKAGTFTCPIKEKYYIK